MPGLDIIFYTEPDGSSPVEEFIDRQPAKAQTKIFDYVIRLRQHDPARGPLPSNVAKALRGGIFELRPEWGNVEYRLLFAYLPERQAVILVGFIKKSQTTPSAEIDRALLRLAHTREQLQR